MLPELAIQGALGDAEQAGDGAAVAVVLFEQVADVVPFRLAQRGSARRG